MRIRRFRPDTGSRRAPAAGECLAALAAGGRSAKSRARSNTSLALGPPKALALGRSGAAIATMAALGATFLVTSAAPAGAAVGGAVTFEYTGQHQTWVVPSGVTSVAVDAFGAQGAGPRASGGRGGRSAARVGVTPGETLEITVGGQGSMGTTDPSGQATGGGGGFGGGGSGGGACGNASAGSGGGGASVVGRGYVWGAPLRMVVAGGGGGSGGDFDGGGGLGGAGGGAVGANGTAGSGYGAGAGGGGGTQSDAGAGGVGGSGDFYGTAGSSGTLSFGGAGGESDACTSGGGGGGGGAFGGGGGGSGGVVAFSGSPGGAGGGGSGLGPARVRYETGVRSGHGLVTITPLKLPAAPTNVTATPDFASARVSFSPPATDPNTPPITSYTAVSNPGGITARGSSSPLTVSGLTNGTTYTFTVYATNTAGNGPASAASNAVTPSATPFYAINDISLTEGHTATKLAAFTVSRFGNTTVSSSVKYATANGSAVAPSDYVARSLTALSFAAGETSKTVNVTVNGDVVLETNESFTLKLSAPVGSNIFDGVGTATILNDDSSAPPTFSVNDVSVTEGNSLTKTMTFTITRSGSLAGTTSVKFATANGTAVAPGDYVAVAPTTVSFAAGQATKPVSVAVKGDLLGEANEYFLLKLSSPTGATVADGTGLGRITNDDTSLAVNDVSLTEGNSGTKVATFTITRAGATGGASSVQWATANGTAVAPSDYLAVAPTTVSFAAGQTSKSVSVTVKGDLVSEANENFLVKLSSATAATIADATGVGTITNDDASP